MYTRPSEYDANISQGIMEAINRAIKDDDVEKLKNILDKIPSYFARTEEYYCEEGDYDHSFLVKRERDIYEQYIDMQDEQSRLMFFHAALFSNSFKTALYLLNKYPVPVTDQLIERYTNHQMNCLIMPFLLFNVVNDVINEYLQIDSVIRLDKAALTDALFCRYVDRLISQVVLRSDGGDAHSKIGSMFRMFEQFHPKHSEAYQKFHDYCESRVVGMGISFVFDSSVNTSLRFVEVSEHVFEWIKSFGDSTHTKFIHFFKDEFVETISRGAMNAVDIRLAVHLINASDPDNQEAFLVKCRAAIFNSDGVTNRFLSELDDVFHFSDKQFLNATGKNGKLQCRAAYFIEHTATPQKIEDFLDESKTVLEQVLKSIHQLQKQENSAILSVLSVFSEEMKVQLNKKASELHSISSTLQEIINKSNNSDCLHEIEKLVILMVRIHNSHVVKNKSSNSIVAMTPPKKISENYRKQLRDALNIFRSNGMFVIKRDIDHDTITVNCTDQFQAWKKAVESVYPWVKQQQLKV